MVYAKMSRIERPEGILVGRAVAVEMKGGRRTYTAYPPGTLADIIDSTAAYTEYSGADTESSVHLLCSDGRLYLFQFSRTHGWGWYRMSIGSL